MKRIKSHLYSLVALFLLHLTIFAKLIFRTPDGMQYAIVPFDFASQYSRWLIFVGDSFRAGIFPLWSPYVGAGTPFFINPQSQLYTPPTLIIATLFGYTQRTAQLQLVTMLFFGGVGAYLLSYSLWKSRWSALVTAICFNFTSAVFTNLEHMPVTNSFTLMPWLFWATTMAARSKSWWRFPALAFFIYFIITSGYPAVIAMTLLWVFIYTLYLLYSTPEPSREKLSLAIRYTLAWLMGLGLSAAHWLPIIIHRKEFTRGAAMTVDQATIGGNLLFKHIWGMLFLFMPSAPLPGEDVDISLRGLYFGALAIPLALAALFFIKERIVPALLVFSVCNFLMACGGMFFGRVALHILFPVLNFSRFPAVDSRTLMVLGLVVLAGGGTKLLEDNHQQAHRLIFRACIVLIALMLIGLVAFHGVLDPAIYSNVALNFITAEIFFIALGLLVLHVFSGRVLMISMCALLALELGTCVLANARIISQPVTTEEYRQLRDSHQRAFTPDAANVPRIAIGPELVSEDAGRASVEKTFYLSDYNPLILRRFTHLIQSGFTDWLTNGKRVVALPPGSQPNDYSAFEQQARPVDYNILSYTPNRVGYKVRAEQDSLLVFNEIYFPGWKATVDGQAVPVKEVSGGLRAVEVAAGEHLVMTRFAPASFYWGIGVSLTSAALFLLWTFLTFYKYRRSAKVKDEPQHANV